MNDLYLSLAIKADEVAQDLPNSGPNMGSPGLDKFGTLAGFAKGYGYAALALVFVVGAAAFGIGGRGNSGARTTGAMMMGGSIVAAILLGVSIPIFNLFS